MIALVPTVVLLPLLGAALALTLAGRPAAQRLTTVLILAAVVVVSFVMLLAVDGEGSLVMEVGGWSAPFGIVLVVDRLSALLLVISAIVLLAVLVFSVGQGLADGHDETPVSIYYPAYLILATGVFTAFIAGDLFNLYVGFEILLVASYVLITLGGTEPRIRAGTTYIVVSLVSSMLFLAAIAMIYGALGTVNLAHIALRIGEVPDWVQIALHLMLLIAFGIKAAVFPLSFWLPDSYPTAPAPVTAVFAGLLTKVGVYAILRVETLIFPGVELNSLLLVVALLTMVVGVLGAVAQTDVKRLLSFTLVSHIGYMILGLGLGTAAGTAAAIYYVVHHIVVQTTLFLATGLIERAGGTTSITRLGGLLAASPLLAVMFFVPALNLGGIPPFSGFIGKLALFEASADQNTPLSWVLVAAGTVVSLLTLYSLIRVWSLAFWRSSQEVADDVAEAQETAQSPDAGGSVEDRGTTETTEAAERAVPDEAAAADAGSTDGSSRTPAEPVGDALTGPRPVTASVQVREARSTPRLMVGATAGMVVVSLLLTVFAGPLYALAARAGDSLRAGSYVTSVFPEGVSP